MPDKRIQFISRLPYALHLKDGNYNIVVDGKKSTISINKIFRYPSTTTIDKSVFEFTPQNQQIAVAHNIDHPEDELGEISFTEFCIDTIIPKASYDEFIEKRDKIDLRPLMFPIINKFIQAYRVLGNGSYSRPVIAEDMRFLEVKFPEAVGDEWKGAYLRYNGKGGLVIASSCIRSDDIHNKIKEYLESDQVRPIYEEFVANAKYFLYKENYRMAIVEVIMALESVLPNFLSKEYGLLGLSNNAIEVKMKKLDLHDMLSFELLLICPAVDRALVDDVKGSNTIRNKITHQGFKDVSKSDAIKAIEKVSELINYLNSNFS